MLWEDSTLGFECDPGPREPAKTVLVEDGSDPDSAKDVARLFGGADAVACWDHAGLIRRSLLAPVAGVDG